VSGEKKEYTWSALAQEDKGFIDVQGRLPRCSQGGI